MISGAPLDVVLRVPRAVPPTLMARRLRTATGRNGAAWPVRQPQHYLEERLASTWRGAELSEALEPLGLPDMPRAEDSNSHLGPREIATWQTVRYAGRLITFNLAVVIVHIAVLWWIFLRIGS